MPAAPHRHDRDRRLALGLAAALLLVLFAPWYHLRVGLTGAARSTAMTQTLTGWDSLSLAAVACGLLALGILARLVAGRTVLTGLGAAARTAARRRTDGRMLLTGGLVSSALLALNLLHHPAPAPSVAGVTSAAGIGWGFGVALLICIAIGALGARIAGRATDATDATDARPPDAAAAAGPRRVRATRGDRRRRTERLPAEPAVPEFDFTRVPPSTAAPAARERRRRPG